MKRPPRKLPENKSRPPLLEELLSNCEVPSNRGHGDAESSKRAVMGIAETYAKYGEPFPRRLCRCKEMSDPHLHLPRNQNPYSPPGPWRVFIPAAEGRA